MGKKPVIVIDELQMLKEIYTNGGRGLLEKLFNFFVTITKSKHLAQVICMSSDSLFIDEIYNNSVLKKTSKFYLFNSFDKKTTVEWLVAEGINEKTAKRVFEKVGGECWYLQEYLKDPENLDEMIKSEESFFEFYLGGLEKAKMKRIEAFLSVFKKKEEISFGKRTTDIDLMKELVKEEILFYDPNSKGVKPQSRLMLNVLRKVV